MEAIGLTSEEHVDIPVLKATQPIGDFYVGVVPWKLLSKISRADIRRLVEVSQGAEADIDQRGTDDVFEYMGIQRPLDPARVKEIREYVQTVDACFPNTIIVSVSSHDVEIRDSILRVVSKPGTAVIIDGQHRLAGFSLDTKVDFDLLVTFFIDLELEEQAYLFSTINTKQTRINPSLARDLLEFSSVETPEKVAHAIAKSMNTDINSPWHGQIKMLGSRDASVPDGQITQHAFVTQIVGLIYPTRTLYNRVRSTLKESRNQREKLRGLDFDSAKYPLWGFYIERRDDAIKKILVNYFSTVRDVFPEDWLNPAGILSKTTGYRALMVELRQLLIEGMKTGNLSKDFFMPVLSKARGRLELSRNRLTVQDFGAGEDAARQLWQVMFGTHIGSGNVKK